MRRVIIVIVVFAIQIQVVFAQNWQTIRNEDGIWLYSREVEGSDIVEFKAETTINARIEVIGEVLRDVEANPEWVADCSFSEIISKKDANNFTFYLVQDLPWPADDRDVVLNTKTAIDYASGSIDVYLNAVNTNQKKNDDYVRMKNVSASYKLQYTDRQHTKVIYRIYADPGGNLAASLVNSFSAALPIETLLGLRRMVKKDKYIQAANKSEDKKIIEELIKKGKLKR